MKPAVVASVFALCVGCGTSASSGSDSALDAGRKDDGGSVAFVTGEAAATQRLDAYIERGTVAVKLVTVSCAGDCATVQAVGTGGYPPYTFAWENGSTSAVRRVCPTADTDYSVRVTDSGGTGELPRPPQTAKASVTADVLACSDAGPRDAASAVPSTDGCVGGFMNPSVEGTPQTAAGGAWDAPGWTQCLLQGTAEAYLANQSVGPTYPAPSAGKTYAVIPIEGVPASGGGEGFSQELCAPAAAGASFRFDAMVAMPEPPGAELGLVVSTGVGVCDQSGPWLFNAPLTMSWKTYCVTFAQATPAVTFTFSSNNPVDTALLLVDNIVPVSSCP